MPDAAPEPAAASSRVDLVSRRLIAREIRASFTRPSSIPEHDPSLADFKSLLTKWEQGGVHGRLPSTPSPSPHRPTDQNHG